MDARPMSPDPAAQPLQPSPSANREAPQLGAAKPCNVGGQAVIEGVMMRSPRSFAVVCRRPGGAIVVREERWRSIWERLRFLRWPFLRGSVVLVESLVNGMSALGFSAQQQEENTKSAPAESDDSRAPAGETKTDARRTAGEKASFTAMLVVSLLAAVLIFKAVPHLLTTLIGLKTSSIAFHLVDGGFKVLLLVGYIGSIGLMKDVRRVFQYHGAEHKAIWAYEQGLELTVENVRAQTRFHPRCGTSFMVLVILISVFLFALVLRYPISSVSLVDNLIKILIKVPLMLPVAGLSYEAIKLSGKFRGSPVVRLLVAPGMWLQRLTTREPSDDQLEVGLLALQTALRREQAAAELADVGVQVYASYAEAAPALKS
jgi:uncharacterized protein YqhQ